jgi:HEPN domain-containing protein
VKASFEQWVQLSEYRLRSAHILHESGQHLDAVFHFQQAIEYLLKAVVARQGQTPPRTHDLLELAGLLSETLPAPQLKTLDELHDISVPLRYPDDLNEALEAYTYDEVKRIGDDSEGLLKWLKQKLS